MLSCGLQIHFGFFFRIPGYLQVVQRDRAMGMKILGALELRAREFLVGNGFAVIRIASGNVIAANPQQHVALFDRIAQASANLHDAARGQRDDRHVPRNVWSYNSRHNQFRPGCARHRCDQRNLFRMIDLDHASVLFMLHLRRRGRLRFRIGIFLATARIADRSAASKIQIEILFISASPFRQVRAKSFGLSAFERSEAAFPNRAIHELHSPEVKMEMAPCPIKVQAGGQRKWRIDYRREGGDRPGELLAK